MEEYNWWCSLPKNDNVYHRPANESIIDNIKMLHINQINHYDNTAKLKFQAFVVDKIPYRIYATWGLFPIDLDDGENLVRGQK